MPDELIRPDATAQGATLADDLLDAVETIREGFYKVQRIRNILDRAHDGEESYTSLETACGLQVGEGQQVFDMLNGTLMSAQDQLQSAQLFNLINRVVR